MIAASTRAMRHPPYCVRGPLRNARHLRPSAWMRRLVSRPGSEAYCGVSLVDSQDLGGLFQPGTAVDAVAVDCSGFMPRSGLTGTLPVGAVTGGGGVLPRFSSAAARSFEGACARTARGCTNATPRISAPRWRAVASNMIPPLFGLGVAGADVFVLGLRALRERLLVGNLVALEEVACIRLGVLLAGVRLGRVLRDLVAVRARQRRDPQRGGPHSVPPGWSFSLSLPP